jgi:hypothetical protein
VDVVARDGVPAGLLDDALAGRGALGRAVRGEELLVDDLLAGGAN